MILLHGGIECGGVYWAPVVRRLAERFQVLIPDVPGLGESEPFPELTDGAFARWFDDLLRATRVQRPVLVAHSLLGRLAARYAVATRELIRDGNGKLDWERLREMCSDVSALRRGDHRAGRLALERAKLEETVRKSADVLTATLVPGKSIQ